MNNSNTSTDTASSPATQPPQSIQSAVEHAKRAFALKKYEQAVELYATALEIAVPQFGDSHPDIADLYLLYGKALLENAISQSGVLGKEKAAEEDQLEEQNASTSTGGPILSFSGDAEDGLDEDPAVDLLSAEDHEQEDNGDEEEDEDAEPEDDFNAAWEVLDLARAIYDKQQTSDGGGEHPNDIVMKLADTYITLGDVSLETEKFDQAITDYEQGLALKSKTFPFTSRQIAEAHYKLSIVLDLTSGRLSDSIYHAEKALESVQMRLNEMRQYLDAGHNQNTAAIDTKGKRKALVTFEPKDDSVEGMSKSQIESEIRELLELEQDLALKVEELKTTPSNTTKLSAPALAEQALDQELQVSSSSTSKELPVNDLTMVVKKKKKAPEEPTNNGKRKAEDQPPTEPPKKAKADADT